MSDSPASCLLPNNIRQAAFIYALLDINIFCFDLFLQNEMKRVSFCGVTNFHVNYVQILLFS